MALTTIFSVFAGIIAVAIIALYLFGISPETKRKLERQTLNAMGENKMSYAVKDGIGKIPDGDNPDLQGLKNRVTKTFGGAAQNPLGERVGETTDRATAPVTGRNTDQPIFDAPEATINFRQ